MSIIFSIFAAKLTVSCTEPVTGECYLDREGRVPEDSFQAWHFLLGLIAGDMECREKGLFPTRGIQGKGNVK